MAHVRTAMLIAILLLSSFVVGTPAAHAQPVHGYPYGFIHETPTFAANLVPGEMVEVGMWLEMLPGEPTATVRYEGLLGSLGVSAQVTASGRSLSIVTDFVSAEDIMAQCDNGGLAVTNSVLLQDAKGLFSIVYATHTEKAPCSWAPTTVNVPVQVFVCGTNNDVIVMSGQPTNVSLSIDTGWINHLRKIQYTTVDDSVLAPSANFQFTDDPALGCAPVVPMPSPPATLPPYMVPTPKVFDPIIPFPGLPTPRDLPMITVVPVETPKTTPDDGPTPPTKADKSEKEEDESAKPTMAPDSKEEPQEKSESGNIAVMMFAPAALLTGITVAGYRRKQD